MTDHSLHNWQPPDPPLNIVLVEPDIPHNTGSIARTCAATGSVLHLVDPLGFQITDKHMKRAGLDYWEHVTLVRHASLAEFLADFRGKRMFFFSKKSNRHYLSVEYQPGDTLVFGSETRGLPWEQLTEFQDEFLAIPMIEDHVRSLNLSVSAGIAVYGALQSFSS